VNDLKPTHELLQFFAFEHLPPHLRAVSEPFCVLAQDLCSMSLAGFGERASERISQRMAEWEETPIANVEATWAGQKLAQAREWTWANNDPLSHVLRLVLEAKDCAVRAVLYKPVQP
jgi:hypothetical protein